MHEPKRDSDSINMLINNALSGNEEFKTELRTLFDNKVVALGITFNQACELLELEYRGLNALLDGTKKSLDLVGLLKLSGFLSLDYDKVFNLAAEAILKENQNEIYRAKVRAFILEHFDLSLLRSLDIIQSKNDFSHIEKALAEHFDLSSIIDLEVASVQAFYSQGTSNRISVKSREYFKLRARDIFKKINNPNPFNKEGLLEFIPHIRRYSMDYDNGLLEVLRQLYYLGVTVIFLPKQSKLGLRGATMRVNDKPCICLTDYKGFYPTLWFALINEIFHVIFDWNDITEKRDHLSDEVLVDELSEVQSFASPKREVEANNFAREFMFQSDQLAVISPKIDRKILVEDFAERNHVHASVIYAAYAFKNDDASGKPWAKIHAEKKFPALQPLIDKLTGKMPTQASSNQYAEFYNTTIYQIDGKTKSNKSQS